LNKVVDELSEMHIRMGEVIQKVKSELRDINAKDLKDTDKPGVLIDITKDEKTVQAVVNEIVPNDRIRNEGNFNETQTGEPVKEVNIKQNDQVRGNVENSNRDSTSQNLDFSQNREINSNILGSEVHNRLGDANIGNSGTVYGHGHVIDAIGYQRNNTFDQGKQVVVKEDSLTGAQNDTQSNDSTDQPIRIALPTYHMNNTQLDNQKDIKQDGIKQNGTNPNNIKKK